MKNAHGKIKTDEIKLIWLIVGELATWIGASFIWPLTSVYLNKQLHISLSIIGVSCSVTVPATSSAQLFQDVFMINTIRTH